MSGLGADSDNILKGGGSSRQKGKMSKSPRSIARRMSNSSLNSNDSKVSFTSDELREMSEMYLVFKELLVDKKGNSIAQSLSSINDTLKEISKKMK